MSIASEYGQRAILWGLTAAGGLLVTSCGSSSGGDSGSIAPPANGGGGGSMLQANFDSIQESVFDARCITCHIGASAPQGLRLDEANSFALLVGVASGNEPSLLRVDPGNPDDSYLIRKLEGTQSVGARMPLGGPFLPQADIDVIRQWIIDGALRGTEPPPTEPIRVSSMSPLPDSEVAMLPSTVMAVFDRELDANSVDETTFLVERSGGDGTFDDGNEVEITPVSVTVPAMNPSRADFDLSTTTSVEDTYRVTLAGTGGAMILDLDGNALDGEFDGSFPSGDGEQGGDFVATFEVVGIQPTLESIQEHVFTPICSGCHTGPTSDDVSDLPSGMDLTNVTASFMALVETASLQEPDIDRVAPEDPDNSYVIQKLEGTAETGDRMPPPFAGDALDQGTIDAIRQWISDGASM